MKPFAILMSAIALVAAVHAEPASSDPVPTVLAKRGELLVDDDGSLDRGKGAAKFPNGTQVRAGAGAWARSPETQNAWRSTWSSEMGHTPVMSYQGFREDHLIAEVTFRYGEMNEPWHTQCFRVAFDQRPDVTGHVVSAWANPNNDFIETGFLLQHIRKTTKKVVIEDLLLDRQPLSIQPGKWYTAVLEVVGDQALFRMGDHVAYARAAPIQTPKNLVSLTLGKTWHEVRRVRIWRAEARPLRSWEEQKSKILSSRQPFAAKPHDYQQPKP
jgi:hypothetical protein